MNAKSIYSLLSASMLSLGLLLSCTGEHVPSSADFLPIKGAWLGDDSDRLHYLTHVTIRGKEEVSLQTFLVAGGEQLLQEEILINYSTTTATKEPLSGTYTIFKDDSLFTKDQVLPLVFLSQESSATQWTFQIPKSPMINLSKVQIGLDPDGVPGQWHILYVLSNGSRTYVTYKTPVTGPDANYAPKEGNQSL